MKLNRTTAPLAMLAIGLALAAHAQAPARIVIDGSTGVTPLVAALAKSYLERNPSAAIEIGKGMGTRARIAALRDGKIDIAMASHGLNVAEIEQQGMTVHEFAKVAVVFAVNSSVSVANLADAQICAIYLGKVKNWKELGGPDLPIVPFTRPDSEVDTEVVREKIPCLTDLKMPDFVKVAPKAGEMAQALAETSGGFGMTTMTVVEQSQARVRALSLRGTAPSAQNMRSQAYTLTRDSFLVVKAPLSPPVAAFLEYVRGANGAKTIAANGAVPVAARP